MYFDPILSEQKRSYNLYLVTLPILIPPINQWYRQGTAVNNRQQKIKDQRFMILHLPKIESYWESDQEVRFFTQLFPIHIRHQPRDYHNVGGIWRLKLGIHY